MKSKGWVYFSFTALAFIGAAALIVSTRLGPGVGGDATIYMTSASNLVKGIGLGIVDAAGEFRLLPYFPPLFPLALAFFAWLGIAPLQSALWLNILLFALTIWLAGFLVFRAGTGGLCSVLAAALVTVSPVFIPVYSWAMAEPLAIFFGLTGIGLTLAYLKRPYSTALLVGAGFAAGLSVLTRYSMGAFLGAGAVGILLLSSERLRSRLARAGVYLLAGILPAALWIGYDLSRTAALSSRSVESSMGMLSRLKSLWSPLGEVFLFWLIPDSWISAPPYPVVLNNLLLAGMTLTLAGCLGWAAWAALKNRPAVSGDSSLHLSVLLALVIAAYLVLIGLVYITTYPPITIGTRMFSPLHIMTILLTTTLAGRLGSLARRNHRRAALLTAGLMLLMIWWGWRSARIVAQNAQQGMGFNALSWRQSETVRALKDIPPDIPLVTNEEMAVYYLAGRAAYPLTEIYADRPLETFDRYGDGILSGDKAQRVFRQEGAALVLFDSLAAQLEPLYGNRTDGRIQTLTEGLRVIFRGEDGGIYKYPQP